MSTHNPFTERGIIRDPKLFFGRERELAQVFERLQAMQNVSVVGERRIGKSSLLTTIAAIGRDRLGPDYEIHYIDLQRVESAQDFVERALRTLDAAGETMRDLEREIENRLVIFCLDEFEQTAGFPADFFNTLRSLAQTGHLALVVATQSTLADLASEGVTTSPFFNIFTTLPLSEMSEEEAGELLNGLAQLGEKKFSKEQIHAAYMETKGNPWKLQIFGEHLFETDDVNEATRRYRNQLKLSTYNGAGTVNPEETQRRANPAGAQQAAGTLLVISAVFGFASMLTNSVGGIVVTVSIATVGLIIEGVSMIRGKAA